MGGDSAGGNIATNLAHMAPNGNVPQIVFQLLLYPGTDMSMSQPSYQRDFSKFPLSIEACRYFLGHYLRDERDKADWRASPLHAPIFKGLAPALVLTAGYDPLADEGLAYAKKMEESGVPVTVVHMSDQMHGFLTMGKISKQPIPLLRYQQQLFAGDSSGSGRGSVRGAARLAAGSCAQRGPHSGSIGPLNIMGFLAEPWYGPVQGLFTLAIRAVYGAVASPSHWFLPTQDWGTIR